MRRTKILFCSQTYTPIGGVETWLDTLCRSLAEKRWQPIVALVRGSEAHRPETWKEAHPGLRTTEIDGRGLNAVGRIRAIERCIRRVKPDIFVPVGVVDAYDAICHLKLKGSSTRLVMTIHGNTPSLIADMARYQNFADLVVCPGALTCRLATQWVRVPEERVRHVPNGVFSPRVEHRPRKAGQPIRLGYVGRLVQRDKRVLDLISFCQKLETKQTSYSLDIVGAGESEDELKRGLIERVGQGTVRFHGPLSLDEIYTRIYPQLDCLLLFSPQESFGMALVEAMAHGVVPVSTAFVGQRTEGFLSPQENCLLFEVGDTGAAAANVKWLQARSEVWSQLSRQAKASVRSYDWGSSTTKWSQLFESLFSAEPVAGQSAPQRPLGPDGKLDRAGLPPLLIDALRYLRRQIVGLPPLMIGGEEWPFINKDHSPQVLEQISQFSQRLDRESPELFPSPSL